MITIGALILIGVGFVVYTQQRSEVAPLDSNVLNEKPTRAETELDTTKSNETKTDAPVIANAKILDLSNQGLKKVPSDTFTKTEIQELNVSNNSLDGSLQAEVRNLQNLKVLNLSNNNFTGVPAEIGQLKNLEVLNLSNNNLTGLPNELGNLSNLKVLNLKGNNYSTNDLNIIKQKLPSTVVIEID